jgi:dihydrofolate reductase
MRKLIAWAFMYSLDGLLADEGTEYWQFCFGLPVDPAELKQKIGVYQSAYAHIMGRAAYEAMAGALPTRQAQARRRRPHRCLGRR